MAKGKILNIDDHNSQNKLEKDIIEFNKKHAVILVGSKCLVMIEKEDPVFNRQNFLFLDVKDFDLCN